MFIDPIADIAVLGSPDNQALGDQAEAYEALVEAATPLTIAEPPSKPTAEEAAELKELEKRWGATGQVQRADRECPAFMLSLNNQWFLCRVRHAPNGMLMVFDAAEKIAGGKSGSPIIAADGTAIGVVCLGEESGGRDDREGGPNPRLMGNLPGWFLAAIRG